MMGTDYATIIDKIEKGIYTLSQKSNGRSFVWNILAEIVKEDGTILEGFFYCRKCKKILKIYKNQTSNLCRHKCCVNVKNPTESRAAAAEERQPLVLKNLIAEDRQLVINTCVDWITKDCLPCSYASGSGFAKLVKFFFKIGAQYGENVNIDDLLPDAAEISRKVRETADEKREVLSAEIKNIVKNGDASVTVDMWSDSHVKRNFLSATLHYQKNFEAFNIVLGLKSMDIQRSTSENILIKLKKLLNKYNVEEIDAIKFVADQDANLAKALKHKTYLNCSSHLLANVLDKSFEETCELKEILEACKNLVKYFKRSNLKHKLPTSVKSHCSKRWDSNYTILTTISNNWNDITTMLVETEGTERHLQINISTLAVLVELCKHFEVIFKKLQACNSPSLSFVLPSIYKIKSLCITKNTDIPAISALKENIVKNTDLIWVQNLSIWHMAAFFLFPPAVSKQQNDLKSIQEFCVSQILSSFNCDEAASTSGKLNDSTYPDATCPNKPISAIECISSNECDNLLDIKEACLIENPNFYPYQTNSSPQPFVENDLAGTSNSTHPEMVPLTPDTNLLTDEKVSFNRDYELNEIKDPSIVQNKNNHNCAATLIAPSLLSTDLSNTSNSALDTNLSVNEYASTNKENHFFFANWLDTSDSLDPLKESVKNEVEKYSKETVKMTEDFDLIQWWRINEKYYPRLSKFALQIHSIPASCAASDHAASLVGNIINEKRCRLEPKSLDSLLFLNSYLNLNNK